MTLAPATLQTVENFILLPMHCLNTGQKEIGSKTYVCCGGNCSKRSSNFSQQLEQLSLESRGSSKDANDVMSVASPLNRSQL